MAGLGDFSQDRVTAFLRKAEIDPPPHIEALSPLPALTFAPSENDFLAARALLVEQRINTPGYRPSEQKKRNFFKNDEWKKRKADTATWLFTPYEVAKVFDALARSPAASVTLAQAILSYAPTITIKELWCRLHDQKPEKRMKRRFFSRNSSFETVPDMIWLDWTIENDLLDYIRLLCAQGVDQDDLNRAFGLALSKNLIEAMKILLRAGAVASSYQTLMQEQIKLDNTHLADLLICAPRSLSIDAWRVCIEFELLHQSRPDVLAKFLAHHPDIVSPALLSMSLSAGNVAATATILAYAKSDAEFIKARQLYCKVLCLVEDDKARLEIFSLLAMAALLDDMPVLQQELLKDVKARHLELVRILVNARVTVDIEPNNAVSFAVSNSDLEVLEIFRNAVFASPVSPLLDLLPVTASQPYVLQVIDILGHKGFEGDPLHAQLVRAVQKQHTQVVTTLLLHGASVEYQEASAVRIALEKADLPMLDILLKQQCSPKILSSKISVAMGLSPRSVRMQALECLTKKGVLAQELGVPLQTLTAESGEVDYDLVRLLLRHSAPIDDVGDSSRNVVLVATKRGLVPLLRLFCAYSNKKETLSNTLPWAFNAVRQHGRETAFRMLEVLLQNGAKGELLHQTLRTAVNEDDTLEIIQLLLNYGANANYQSGASYADAFKLSNFELVKCLCTACPPTPHITKSVLPLAMAPSSFNLDALDLLLGSTTSGVGPILNAFWSSEQFRGRHDTFEIVRCFLDHGMDVNLSGGTLLCFAIQERDFKLFNKFLSANPNITSMTAAFNKACSISHRLDQHRFMESLLKTAKSVEIGQTVQLAREINHALKGDLKTFRLLLEHKANINSEDGLVVQMAAEAGSRNTLTALFTCHPDQRTIHRACIATMSSSVIGSNEQDSILKCLLGWNKNLTAENMTKILAESVATFPEYAKLPELLLMHGAVVDFELLKVALLKATQTLFTMLADRVWNRDSLLTLFVHSHDQVLTSDRRYWISKYFLGRGMATKDISEALLKTLIRQGPVDLFLSKLLLDNGAALDYNKAGAVLTSAFNLNSYEIVDLLSRYILDDSLANQAFTLASANTHLSKDTRYTVYQRFFTWNIRTASVYSALVENLAKSLADADIVGLLLQHGADPNQESARCFIEASKRGSEDEFRTLSRYGNPDLEVILQSLLESFKEEWKVVRWFGICLEENLSCTRICKDELLFQCMRTFPNGAKLLKLVLDKGVSASAKINTRLCPGWQSEVCTALLWAVCSTEPRIGNDTILTLISRGGREVFPAYSAPLSNLTAAFACVLDSTRTDVLHALLAMDLKGVMGHTMLESKFTHLAANSEKVYLDPDSANSTHEIDLRTASIFTGNFEAFKLMRFKNEPNDGTIITAVMLALPKFIKWLLANGHDPNYRSEDSNMLIPLAMLCSSQPMASCKVANAEADFVIRRKDAMKILAAVTDLSWKYRGKTVLHYALDQGPLVTQAMVDALNVCRDKERDEKYVYTDRARINYSLDEYVRRLMTDLKESQKDALIKIIQACDMKSRYYKDVEPGQGREQPVGFKGLPPRLQVLWNPTGVGGVKDEGKNVAKVNYGHPFQKHFGPLSPRPGSAPPAIRSILPLQNKQSKTGGRTTPSYYKYQHRTNVVNSSGSGSRSRYSRGGPSYDEESEEDDEDDEELSNKYAFLLSPQYARFNR